MVPPRRRWDEMGLRAPIQALAEFG